MAKLNKDTTQLSGMQVNNNVSAIQPQNPSQNSVNKLATPDPNYASVRETKQPEQWNVDTRGLWQQFVEDVIKPYSAEDIKLSPMPKIEFGEEIRPQDTFEETAWGRNYNYDRAVSQANNQQGSLNALQWTGHVAWIPETNIGNLQLNTPKKWLNVANAWPRFGNGNVEEATPETPAEAEATPTTVSNTGMWGGFNWGWITTTQNQRQLKNADINFSQYGDDSSAPNQATMGGQNEKYTGEFVKNSNLGYDPNIRTADLDPSYMFWMDAQWANTDAAGYIARRNDMIASALFNDAVAEWRLPTKDDVINYLAQQDGRMNSTEADRFNTIESIWKRLGGLSDQAQWPDLSNVWATYSDAALNNMENDLNKSTSGELYGKVTADQDTHIKTLEDDNSVYEVMNESRIAAYKQLRGMDSQAIAASIVSGVMASDSQSMRDLMQYDPDKYEYVMQAVKQMRGQQNINSITSWEWDWSSSITNWSSSITNEITDFALWNSTSTTSTADILKSVNSTLSSNDVASTASEQMASIENDMINLQNRLKNLKKEANQVFKWDVPQYIVNAYVANRTAEIQDQLWVLENRYNAAYSRYQNEWEQTKWAAEFDLKKQELELKKQNAALDDWATRQGIAIKWADLNWTTNGTTPLSTLSVQESLNILSDFSSSYATGTHGGQCWEFVKKYLAQIGINLPNVSSISSKMSLIDDSISEPNQWDVVIMSSENYPENWHMAIVEWIDDDGTIHLLESNWGGDEQVHRRTISPKDKRILGYYRPTGSTINSGTNGGTFVRKDWATFDTTDTPTYNSLTYDQQNVVQQLLNLNKNPNTITKRQYWDDFEKILSAVKEINPAWTEDDYKQASSYKTQWNKWANWGWISRNATSVKAAKELYDMVDTLDNIPNMTLNQLINASEQEFGWTKISAFKTKLEGMIVEAAGALKWGNAANSDQDIQRMNNILDTKMSKGQIKVALKELVNLLYWKNESEASTYWDLVLVKPNPIWVDEVTDRMYNDLWITTIPQYYNYAPDWGRYAMWQTLNNLSNDEMVNNIFSY